MTKRDWERVRRQKLLGRKDADPGPTLGSREPVEKPPRDRKRPEAGRKGTGLPWES